MVVSLHLILVALNKQKGKIFFPQRLLCQEFTYSAEGTFKSL